MKVQNITDIEGFFKVVDQCRGKVIQADKKCMAQIKGVPQDMDQKCMLSGSKTCVIPPQELEKNL